jgi:hypothetical protein
MPLYRALLQTLGATVLLAMALACGGSSGRSSTAATATAVAITGKVTYLRVPLAKDAQGVPIGLVDATVPANLQTLPARGVVVRAYQQVEEPDPQGNKIPIWVVANVASTDSTGAYTLTAAYGHPTMIEVLSVFNGGNNFAVNLVGEPAGINSPTVAPDRMVYSLRKAVDGTTSATTNMPCSVLPSTGAALDFTVGLNDTWWLNDPAYNRSSTLAPLVTHAVLETSLPGRTTGQGSGSRILGIGDTIASFVAVYGGATPGMALDLHYWPGRSEPRGSYIEYDHSRFPQSFDPTLSGFHYFGSLRGGPDNDDAWDEGVIMPLLARNFLFVGNSDRTFSGGIAPLFPIAAALPNLSPDMARIEGLADAMAANVLKSPYLADTQGTSLAAPVKDIRDLTGLDASQLNPYSAPAIRAFAWEIILKANSQASPGTATTWATIDPLASARFFYAPVGATNGAADSTARDIEPLNIYSQITRLKESKSATDTVDLATIFTDPVLAPLATPFGITYPRPTTGPLASFVTDWGADPNSTVKPLAPIGLSMAKAVQVNGAYPNLSQGEVTYAGFTLSADKRYVITVNIAPALSPDAHLDLNLPYASRPPFTFTGAGGTTEAFVLPVTNTPPFYHSVRLQVVSPTVKQPDVTVTLAFTPAP